MGINFTKFFSTKIFIVLFLSGTAFSQDLSIGVDLVNRYVWRGLELGGDAPSIQPTVALTIGGFNAGFWGAYSFTNEVNPDGSPKPVDEIDFYTSYSFELGENAGGLSLGFTDYMNPNSGTKIGNIHNHTDAEGPGAHFIELNAGYSFPDSLPLSLSFNMFLYNVANNPIYIQLGYNTTINDIGLALFVGGTTGDNDMYYGTDKLNIINAGFTVSKTIPVTEKFGLPIFGSVMLNPASEHLFYVIGIKL